MMPQAENGHDRDPYVIHADQSVAFLSLLYGEDTPGRVVLFGLPSSKSWWFDPTNEAGIRECLMYADHQDMYFSTCLHSRAQAQAEWQKKTPGTPFAGRGVNESAICVPGVFGDF